MLDTKSCFIGMKAADLKRYSLLRVLRGNVQGGIEAEMSAEVQKTLGQHPDGVAVPFDVLFTPGRRDLNVTTFGQGGAFVETSVQDQVIPLLRNRMVARRLGCELLDGLSGNVAIPRQTGAATVQSLGESATGTASTQSVDQIMLTPHRVFAATVYTKQLLLQSSPSVEAFLRDDLLKQIALKWDSLVLNGAGSNSEPTGIANVNGIGSVTFGTTATWGKVLAFEKALSVANADAGRMGWATTPAVRAAWKAIPKVSASTFPIFLWEDGQWNDANNDGKINSYRAACTNQIANDTVFFGNWADLVLAVFGAGLDIVVNPYSLDTEAKIRVVVNSFVDVALRHAPSFCISSDSGAQ
jgi:HK97 family phage major capsid protein